MSQINLGTIPDWLSVAAALLTLYIAFKALRTWKQEKLYDIQIEALAKSRLALDIITIIRSPISYIGEIDEEISKQYFKANNKIDQHDQQYLIFHSRLKNFQNEYKDILTLREKLWATFGQTHIFYRFYDKIVVIIHELNRAHMEYSMRMKDKETYPNDIKENRERLVELRNLMFSISGDAVSMELNMLHDELIVERGKNRNNLITLKPRPMKNNSNQDYHNHLRDERNHMEGLMNKRFNFFIVIFGFIVASIPYVNNDQQLKLILVAGASIETIFTLLIGRAYRRLQINVKLLDALGNDPSTEIKKEANNGWKLNPFAYSVVGLMGNVMPILITGLLWISVCWSDSIYNLFKETIQSK